MKWRIFQYIHVSVDKACINYSIICIVFPNYWCGKLVGKFKIRKINCDLWFRNVVLKYTFFVQLYNLNFYTFSFWRDFDCHTRNIRRAFTRLPFSCETRLSPFVAALLVVFCKWRPCIGCLATLTLPCSCYKNIFFAIKTYLILKQCIPITTIIGYAKCY